MLAEPSPTAHAIIGAAIAVHRQLGPGLLESIYERCLAIELIERELNIERQVPVPVIYNGTPVDIGFRADFVVNGTILLELKSVAAILPVHRAQVITYLRQMKLHHGLLINFNVPRLVDGVRSILA